MKTDELIQRSILIITEYYKNNLQPFFESIGEDVLWVGPGERQMIRGRQALIRTFAREEHTLTFTMGSIMAVCVTPHSHVKEILLHYDVYTHYPSGNTYMHDQRLHYTWREERVKTGSGWEYRPEIAVLHISNLWKYDSRDTIYPIHYEDLAAPARPPAVPEHYVTLRASDMSVHRIAAERILYVETVKRAAKLLVHTQSGTLTVNGSLPGFEKSAPGLFLRVHASYLVNPAHVRGIRRFALMLSDGTRIPIPEKKYTQVKKLLLGPGKEDR